MTRPARSVKKLSNTLALADCHDGWWLYDETRGMNLSMRAKSPEEAEANEQALIDGSRLLSAYTLDGEKIWIITEWDRSVTTVLFPSEY